MRTQNTTLNKTEVHEMKKLFTGISVLILAAGSTVSIADQVILDDLIVDGSACIGQDCVNGESFGFDTIRLKENNLRIKAEDTSTTSSFPSRDWQITFNDSSNGGVEKFSIDDIDSGKTPFTIEGNAPSHSLYVDDGGRIGLGTSTPAVEVHVKEGDTPTLRLEQDGSSGFTPQTWDVAGNEANFFVRDVTNGSTLPFRIYPGAPSSALNIEASGDVGVGTTSPTAPLHILETAGAAADVVYLENNGPTRLALDNTASSNAGIWRFNHASNGNLRVADGVGDTELQLDADGNLTIEGAITTSGSCSGGCDMVFSSSYEVESIEEHAANMWENHHLPGVGPTREDGPFNLTEKTGGILNELEKAHIYIEQLNKTLKDREAEIARLNQYQTDMLDRLVRLEAALVK